MLLPLKRLGFSHKLHNHHMSGASSASLRAFRSHISDNLHRLLENSKLGSELLSLKWIHKCFEIIPMINNAFSKMMVEIDYPVTKWEADSMEEYLDYSINLLELLNSVSSSLSHLNQARVSLSHALILMEKSPDLAVERMREIGIEGSIKEVVIQKDEEMLCSENRKIFHEAMVSLKSASYWVCRVVLLGLKSDARSLMEIRRCAIFEDFSLMTLDSVGGKMINEKGRILKEVEDVNKMVSLIVSGGNGYSNGVMELKRRLEVLGNALEGFKGEEEDVFGKVMAARNEVLETLRRSNK